MNPKNKLNNEVYAPSITSKLCLKNVLLSLSNVVDLMHPSVNEHHARVAYIAYRIARAYGCDTTAIRNVVLAALLHDIGAFSAQERLNLLEFEDGTYAQVDSHAEVGYRLLRDFKPFATAAFYIRFHHKPWQTSKIKQPLIHREFEVPIASHIIHLADRIAVLIRKDESILYQVPRITDRITKHNGVFMPELVQVFQGIANREEFWLNILYEPSNSAFDSEIELDSILLNDDQMESVVNLFRRIIDFRSAFTAMHSCGVAVTAGILAKIAGFAGEDIHMIKLAGYLHDFGKIGISSEILEKPTPLISTESSIMYSHPYHTDRILRPLPFFDTVRVWAAQHHERLDGTGYPFHVHNDALSIGSRIIAGADVFAALSENRPYRNGIPIADVLAIMQHMVDDHHLDPDVYDWIRCNAEELSHECTTVQSASKLEYQSFLGKSTIANKICQSTYYL